MGFVKEIIDMDSAKERMGQYPYALANLMSDLYLGTPSSIEIPWDELLEARFFSENEELHIFKCEKDWKAVIVTDNDSNNAIIKGYQIAEKFQSAGKELMIKEYLSDDEDGQVYVEMTRLCGITGGQSNGEKE